VGNLLYKYHITLERYLDVSRKEKRGKKKRCGDQEVDPTSGLGCNGTATTVDWFGARVLLRAFSSDLGIAPHERSCICNITKL